MRKIALSAAVGLIAMSGIALAQSTTANPNAQPGVASTNGARVGPTGGITSGVGTVTTPPAVGTGNGTLGKSGPVGNLGTNTDTGASGAAGSNSGSGTGGTSGVTR